MSLNISRKQQPGSEVKVSSDKDQVLLDKLPNLASDARKVLAQLFKEKNKVHEDAMKRFVEKATKEYEEYKEKQVQDYISTFDYLKGRIEDHDKRGNLITKIPVEEVDPIVDEPSRILKNIGSELACSRISEILVEYGYKCFVYTNSTPVEDRFSLGSGKIKQNFRKGDYIVVEAQFD